MEEIRSQFPILEREFNGKQLVYFDNAATTQKPKAVIEAITDFYQNSNANVHRGLYQLSQEATSLYTDAHKKLADWIGADEDETIFTSGTTEGLNLVANILTEHFMQEGDVIVLTEMEHHSNIIPWQLCAKRKNLKIEWIPVDPESFTLDLAYLDFLVRKYRERIKVLSFVYMSNVLGSTTDVKKLVEIAKSLEVITVLDCAQAVGHKQINVKSLGVDFAAFSGHKMYGPTGTGVLYGRKEILEKSGPWKGGGEMVSRVNKVTADWSELPWKFEAGTPNIAGGVALGATVDWIKENLVWPKVESHERALIRELMGGIKSISGINIFGSDDPKDHGSLISFTHSSIHPHDIASILDEGGIAVRAGYHCAEPIHARFGIGPSVRASVAPYNTVDEVKFFVEQLREGIKKLL